MLTVDWGISAACVDASRNGVGMGCPRRGGHSSVELVFISAVVFQASGWLTLVMMRLMIP